ncbi:MAG: 50S ribosomal protein L30e [Sulfolobales archaeon]|jgi:large subunit ribosomal protein L30e
MSQALKDLEGEIKNVVKSGKVVLGFKRSLKAILLGRAKAVIVADKIPKAFYEDISRYAVLGGVPVIKFNGSSKDLGLVCGKPFPVTVIAVLDLSGTRLLDFVSSG